MTVYSISADVDFVSPDDDTVIAQLGDLSFLVIPHWVGNACSLHAEASAGTPQDALDGFHREISGLGIRIRRYDLGLMSVSDIATELDVSRETVRLWSTGSRRGHFPDRFAHVGSSRVWAWSEVYHWARDNGYELEDRGVPLPLWFLEKTNGILAGSQMTVAP